MGEVGIFGPSGNPNAYVPIASFKWVILTLATLVSLVPPSIPLYHGKKLTDTTILQPRAAEGPSRNRSSQELTSICLTKMPRSRTLRTTFGAKDLSLTSLTQSKCQHVQPYYLPRVQGLEVDHELTRGDQRLRNMRCALVDLVDPSNNIHSFPSYYISSSLAPFSLGFNSYLVHEANNVSWPRTRAAGLAVGSDSNVLPPCKVQQQEVKTAKRS